MVALVPGAVSADPSSPANTSGTKLGNPIRPMDTADPGVVRHGGKWYVYHTSSGVGREGRYPIVVSDDLTSWSQIGYIIEPGKVPAWASKAWSWWAPEVHKVGNRFIAYYTTREDATNRFVVGAAVAPSPAGPFVDVGAPIVRNPDVGLIDVSLFNDPKSGRNYIIWKEDQNDFNPPRPTPLIMSELGPDGLTLVGEPKELLRNTLPWEGVLVEAPSLVYRGGWYYLFYSGNIFTADEYSVGVARSRDIWGPYVKKPEPILVHDANFSGPAHQFVIRDENDGWHMFYHARIKNLETKRRYLMHDMITWGEDGWPVINEGNPGGPLNEPMMRVADDDYRQAVAARDKARAAAREAARNKARDGRTTRTATRVTTGTRKAN